MRPRAFESIAQELEKAIRADPATAPTSINDVAGRFRVAYRTAWKAVHVLVDKGIINVSAGRAIAVADKHRSKDAAPRTTSDRVHAALKSRILDGTYHVGKGLPKAAFIATSENVSTLTVSRILQRLAGEGLVHKLRNRWYVGPASAPSPASSSSRTAHDDPVILVLNDYPEAFFFALGDTFAYGFLVPFSSETMAHRIQLLPVQIENREQEVSSLPTGLDEVKSLIKSLGSRYCGTLAMTIYPLQTNLAGWISALSSLGKPVVYFDYAQKGAHLSRAGLPSKRQFFRPHMDEAAAAALALEELTRDGHRVIGIHGSEQFEWAVQRAERISEYAQRLKASPTIAHAGRAEELWLPQRRLRMSVPITSIVESAMVAEKSQPVSSADLAARLMATCPSFVSLLRDERPTALIAMNDETARDYYFWCNAVGIRVPDDLSIISFDNVFESMLFPVSTIDFGFARLGYLAAHIFIGDIPVHADRSGTIAGKCTLIDRGSIAPPRNAEATSRMMRLLRGSG